MLKSVISQTAFYQADETNEASWVLAEHISG
jgi:hypothetical protein